MNAATVKEIREELEALPSKQLVDIIQRLARFKKENKELLTYLLFEAHDLSGYISGVRLDMEASMLDINPRHLYQAKKTIRKTLRLTNTYIRFSGSRQAEAELLMHFCNLLKRSGIELERNQVLLNLYSNQIKKIKQSIATLHEDLQYDLSKQLEELSRPGWQI
jgi:hypothetical protein